MHSHLAEHETRTWNELDSEKAYHETIFYKVEKWESSVDGAPVGREPLQNFYFPNSTAVVVKATVPKLHCHLHFEFFFLHYHLTLYIITFTLLLYYAICAQTPLPSAF